MNGRFVPASAGDAVVSGDRAGGFGVCEDHAEEQMKEVMAWKPKVQRQVVSCTRTPPRMGPKLGARFGLW